MHAGTIAVITDQLNRVPIFILPPRLHCGFFQPGHIHMFGGLWERRKILAKTYILCNNISLMLNKLLRST